MLGETIGARYKLVRMIGEGGMGTIYEGVHTQTGRHVAVKVIRATLLGEEHGARFLREQRAAAALGDEHIVQVLDGGIDEASGIRFFAMELLEGEDVGQLLLRLGPLPAEPVLRIAAQACLGLEAAHTAGIIHRDIKPENLFVTHRAHGDDLVIKLLDFGVAKKLDDTASKDLTTSGVVLGSARFMSPEQVQGARRVDARSDLWSLGMVMYKMLSGRTACDPNATFGQILVATCSMPATPIRVHAPWVEPKIAAIIHCCLQIDASKRYASAREMREAILQILPDAATLRESMLIPLPDDVVAAADAQYATTAVAESSKDAGVATKTRSVPWQRVGVPAALAVALVTLLGVMRLAASRVSTPEPSSGRAGPGTRASVESAAMSAEASAPVTSTPIENRSVSLRIVPPTANVEIDGNAARAEGGSVVLEGAPGSAHIVKLTQGTRAIVRPVVITETGALPDTLSLPDAHAPTARPVVGAAAGTPTPNLELDKKFR
jgi:serine/threonine protein kinase